MSELSKTGPTPLGCDVAADGACIERIIYRKYLMAIYMALIDQLAESFG
jgi:hypothetical protein